MTPDDRRLSHLAATWSTHTRGASAVLFAIVIIPLVLLVAFAIDSARQVNADRHVQFALDAASLAGVLAMEDPSHSAEDIKQISLDAFQANLSTAHGDVACGVVDVEVNRTDMSVRVLADCAVPSMIQGSMTPQSLAMSNAAKARATSKRIDLALMLDVSSSMSGHKLDFLKTAAKETARTLISVGAEDRVRLSFVSYASAVNAGRYGNLAQGRAWDDDSDNDGVDKVCVSERSGSAARKDDRPGPGKWMSDRARRSCPESSLLPLTTDLDAFEAAIDGLEAHGLTAGHLGVAWAWYLVSPKWSDIWPSASTPLDYDEPDSVKAVILMTDGNFNRTFLGHLGQSDQQAKKLCEAMRDQGILVYAVAFRAPPRGRQVLENCAGSAQRYFETRTGEELLNAYAAIASQLSGLTLTE